MKEDWQEFKMRVVKHAMKQFDENRGINTCLYTVTDTGNYKIIPAPPEVFSPKAPVEAKEKLADIFRHMLSDINAEMCCFVTEAWMYAGEAGEKDHDPENLCKEHWDEYKKTLEKFEILNMIFEFKNKKEKGYFMCFKINRDDKDKPTLIPHVSETINKQNSTKGTFNNLLKYVK